MTKPATIIAATLAGLALSITCHAAPPVADKASDAWLPTAATPGQWHGFKVKTFKLDGIPGEIAEPATAADGRPWLLFVGGLNYHSTLLEELLRKGVHVVTIASWDLYGSEQGLALLDTLFEGVRKEYRLAGKTVLYGVSRGGLTVYRYAVRHPERVAGIYAEGAVMDFKTWPKNWPPSQANWVGLKQLYGFKTDADAEAFKGNPLDLLAPIAAAKIPLRHLVAPDGEHDTKIVPYQANTMEAQRRLKALGHDMDVVVGKDKNKFPLPSDGETIEFIVRCGQPGGGKSSTPAVP